MSQTDTQLNAETTTSVVHTPSTLKSLLDQALGHDYDISTPSSQDLHQGDTGAHKNQLNLSKLFEFLGKIVDNQTQIQIHLEETREIAVPSTPVPSTKSTESIFDKDKLPPISRSNTSLTPKFSAATLASMDFAQKYDLDKVTKRIDLLQAKVDKLVDIVPSNKSIISSTDVTSSDSKTSTNEAWSKHVLTKRIESNEESLDKFTQLIDDLANKLNATQADCNAAIRNSTAAIKKLSEDMPTSDTFDKLKQKIKGLPNTLEELSNRIASCESGLPKLDAITESLGQLSKAVAELDSKTNGKLTDLVGVQKSLEKMIMALEKQIKTLSLKKSSSNSSTDHCSDHDEPIEAGPDLETIKIISDLQHTTTDLGTRVDTLETNFTESATKEDLVSLKAQMLTENTNYINQHLEDLLESIRKIELENNRLNELMSIKDADDKISVEHISRKSSISTVDGNPSDVLKTELDAMSNDINTQLVSLSNEFGNSIQSLWDEFNRQKAIMNTFETDITTLRREALKSSTPVQLETPLEPTLANISIIPPVITTLLDRLEKSIYSMQTKFNTISDRLAIFDIDNHQRDKRIESIEQNITQLTECKADREEVEKLVSTKADAKDLADKLSRDDFDVAFQDISKHVDDVIARMVDQEKLMEKCLEGLTGEMSKKLNKDELAPFKAHLDNRLKSLKILLEKSTRDEANCSGLAEGDQSAIARKPLQYRCVSCDKVTYPKPGDPVASIPGLGSMHLSTIGARPYTTFDLHTIREESRTGHARLDFFQQKKRLETDYRAQVAETMNYAFDAYQQGQADTEAIPVTGGSSIPNGYAISKPGRSCGGTHTMTQPHKRYTHLMNLSDMWNLSGEDSKPAENQPSEPSANLQTQFENSKREVELFGHDGHIYKGRVKSHAAEE